MTAIGLYLAGAGSLDGSDPFLSTFAYEALQQNEFEVTALGRDVEQGEVLNHRFAHRESNPRNSLDESARLVRGGIDDLRDVDTEQLDGAVLVGGGGVLSTWTDFHERGSEARITERLKFHLHQLHNQGKPVLALGNAGFAIAVAFREQNCSLQLNVGKNKSLQEAVERYGNQTTESNPSWDPEHKIGCLVNLLDEENLPHLRNQIHDCISEYLRSDGAP